MPVNQQEIQRFGHLELLAKQVVEGFITGLHKSPFHGFSVEFAEHRLYNTGESTRHIDWKLFGRTEKLFVKRYEEETNLRCQLVIDNSSSMHFPEPGQSKIPNKIDFSVHAAAALAYLLRMQRDAVGLSVFSDTMEMNTPPRSSSVHHKLLFSQFEDLLRHKGLELAKKTVAASALHEIAETIHRRSLVIIFSDMMDSRASSEELFSALQHLRYNKHEVVLFHVVDKRLEEEFMFENRPYRFVDVESGQEIKVHSNEVRASYVQAMADYKRELKLRCGQYRIDFVEADIRQGFEQVLLPFLLKRERMF
ncbi:MAG: DUF58 domain-containing protein [Bacteroidota bacterium]|jgi:uncharacterized protein (DUF58 family)|uniref:DUF58 domain-containing protein n=1 Tax=Candidatus Pollutiaquabacter sp. TaxID=3416354 RepID=UPI001A482908|nr:DUF58 domain-containing protein [Bacteroidota bacterium]MBL7948633.1 DUF58 domain-containing protein [Bacteroidia bacterium]HPD53266.1 DUF58 domain-containing protein [Bacteroidia bacterium]HRU60187.1 DUF58 domain-containing protein [Bacteroidia bacterium]